MREWRNLNWARIERKVFKLQKRIYQATKNGEKRKAKSLSRILAKSHYAKLLAVRQVSQLNRGKKTAGVDGVKSLTPKQRLSMAEELELGTKALAGAPSLDSKARKGGKTSSRNPNHA